MLLTEIQAVSKFVGCVLEDPSQAGGYFEGSASCSRQGRHKTWPNDSHLTVEI